ncbi:phage major capsid protein [Paracoccus sp. p3-h83]|uniref:phage major capsid protein n=1 Tax=Paracoccus sp. p3-h83 TaxID=3342805 RepID=UPI0035B8442B
MPLDEKQIGDIADQMTRISAEMREATQQIKADAAKALDENKRLGALTAETKAAADQALAKQGELMAQADALRADLREVEQRLSGRRAGAGPRQSAGQMIAASDEIAAFAKVGDGKVKVSVQAAITSAPGSAGALIAPHRDPEVVMPERRMLQVKDLLTPVPTISDLIQFARELTRTGAAGVVPDDGVTKKPVLERAWGKEEESVKTIAGIMHIHRSTLADLPRLAAELDGELRYEVELAEEAQIVAGDGTGENMSGLIANATPYAMAAKHAQLKGGTANRIAMVRLAMLQLAKAGYVADAHLLSLDDAAMLDLMADEVGKYIYGNPRGSIGNAVLWGRPVIETLSMPEDSFLTGAFRRAATYYEREATEVLFSTEHGDNFVVNMITVRGEKRAALAVKRPKALVLGDFGLVA